MNFAELLVSNLIGLVVGLVTSFFSWWVLFHWLVPAIQFSESISKIQRSGGSGHSYRIKFQNTGRRAIIGVEVFARLSVNWSGDSNWTGLYIPLSGDGESKYEIPHLGIGGNRVLSFFLNATESFRTNIRYADDFKHKASEGRISMEDVLSLGKAAQIQIFVSGYDAFSGSRKVYMSKHFRLSDIKTGRFRDLSVDLAQTKEGEKIESTPHGSTPPSGA